MRVTLLSRALVRGPYQRKAELIAADPAIDLTVAVPSRWRDGSWEQRLAAVHTDGYGLVEASIVRPGDYHLHFYPGFGGVLDAARAHIAHIEEEPYNLATFLAYRSALSRGARCVFFTWQTLNRRYPPPFRWFERFVHRRSSGAIAGSRGAETVLRAKGYGGPLWVIPQFGVDEDVYSPAGDCQDEAQGLRVGYVGRLEPEKGVDTLLGALAQLQQPWQLRIVGDGTARPGLEQSALEHGVASGVRFESWLDGADLPQLYRSLDVLVLPSRSTTSWIEQFGRVLIEAMACGVACVGSDSGEIPHVLGSAGLVFPEDDAGALAAHLARLASDPGERQRLAQAGRQRVLAEFTMQHIADRTVEVYRNIGES